MSTDSEPKGRALTRRELRELRAKGGEAAVQRALAETDAPAPPERPAAPQHVVASAASAPDAHRTLTRKELRRLRTNEVPIIAEAASDVDAELGEDASETAGSVAAAPADTSPDDAPRDEAVPDHQAETDAPADAEHAEDASAENESALADEPAPLADDEDEAAESASGAGGERRVMPWENPAPAQPQERPHADAEPQGPLTVIDPSGAAPQEPDLAPDAEPVPSEASEDDADGATTGEASAAQSGPKVNPLFGAGIAQKPQQQTSKRTFDELLERNDPTSPSSIILTSSHRLPEGFGSQGSARGTTDGREVDSVLVDGELPAHSSPTPIAASSAISTQKPASEVIRPPEPDKGRGPIIALSITAGVLGIAVIGALGAAYAMGVFNQ